MHLISTLIGNLLTYSVSQKQDIFVPITLTKLLTDFQNSFTVGHSSDWEMN